MALGCHPYTLVLLHVCLNLVYVCLRPVHVCLNPLHVCLNLLQPPKHLQHPCLLTIAQARWQLFKPHSRAQHDRKQLNACVHRLVHSAMRSECCTVLGDVCLVDSIHLK